MRLFIVLFMMLFSAVAAAQTAGGLSAGPSMAEKADSLPLTKGSPAFTQDRVFGGTRFWLLDPGQHKLQIWWNPEYQRDGSLAGLVQAEISLGLAPHLQLDLYQNFSYDQDGHFGSDGQQIVLRYAFARHYNDIPLNPVLYVEFLPRYYDATGGEIKFWIGGDLLATRLLWAINVYYASNLDGFKGTEYLKAAGVEVGATGAVSMEIIQNYFRLGAEIQAGWDQHGNNNASERFYGVCMVGPDLLFKIPDANLKLTAIVFFGLLDHDPRVNPFVIAGWQW